MDGSRATRTATELLQIPPIPAAPAPAAVGAEPGVLARAWAFLFAVGWPVVVAVNTAVEPEPADPGAAEPLVATAAFLAFVVGLVATVVAAARRRPSAAAWSTATALAAVGVTVACPASGHHGAVGSWWFAQMGLSVGMLVASGAALLAKRRA